MEISIWHTSYTKNEVPTLAMPVALQVTYDDCKLEHNHGTTQLSLSMERKVVKP
jgi:hypothetical protein